MSTKSLEKKKKRGLPIGQDWAGNKIAVGGNKVKINKTKQKRRKKTLKKIV